MLFVNLFFKFLCLQIFCGSSTKVFKIGVIASESYIQNYVPTTGSGLVQDMQEIKNNFEKVLKQSIPDIEIELEPIDNAEMSDLVNSKGCEGGIEEVNELLMQMHKQDPNRRIIALIQCNISDDEIVERIKMKGHGLDTPVNSLDFTSSCTNKSVILGAQGNKPLVSAFSTSIFHLIGGNIRNGTSVKESDIGDLGFSLNILLSDKNILQILDNPCFKTQ